MARLINHTRNVNLAENLKIAKTMTDRMVGLLTHKTLPIGEGLWIHRCSSIHTIFMKFSIDAIFVDENLKICEVRENLKPSRLVLPIKKAQSVFELPAGVVSKTQTQIGDVLHVVD